MTDRSVLTDEQWQVFYEFLKRHQRVYIGNVNGCRKFVNAVLYVLRSGIQWRLLPKEVGKWNSVFKRFNRWCGFGVWKELFDSCIKEPDLQRVLLDSTVIRAHACSAGAAGSRAQVEKLGRSCGGFSTKLHAVTDALGNPIAFILSAGQASDIGQARTLLELTPAGIEAVLADKAYDSDEFIEAIQQRDAKPVIPPKANRSQPRKCDYVLYKERHLIECFFGKIKHYRRVFSRYEKKAKNYMGFVQLVSALIWLR